MTQLLGMGGVGTPGTTTGSTSSSAPPSDLSNLLTDLSTGGGTVTPAITAPDTGALDPSSANFDPNLTSSGGVQGPTGALSTLAASAPQIEQAVQDPNAQIPPEQQQTVDRTNKGDFQGPQTVDRSGKGDLQQALGIPPAGPTGQTASAAPATGQPAAAAGAAPPGQAPVTPQQQARQNARAAQAAQTPAPGDAPVAAAPPTAAAGQPQAQPQPQQQRAAQQPRPPAVAAASPVAALNAMGQNAALSLNNLIPFLLRQLFGGGIPGMPGSPIVPAAYAPRSRWARGQPSPAWRQAHGLSNDVDRETGTGQPEELTPAPGSGGNVTPPTAAQVKQTVLAGTDTPPTAGFSPYLSNQRSRYRQELQDPRVRREVAAIAALEHEHDPAAVVESLMNRAAYAKTSLRDMIHSGFYGPVRNGLLPGAVMRMQRNPAQFARMNAGIETALRGSNLLGGATDQGSGNDPNVGHRGGRVRRFGEVYNDWGGGPDGHAGAARFRHQQQEQIRFEQMSPQYQAAHTFGMALTMDLSGRMPPGSRGFPEMEGGNVPPRGVGSPTPDPGQMEKLEEERRKRTIPRQEAIAL